MKRRDFLRAASAATLLPLVPAPVMAAAPAAPTGSAIQYAWAAHYAQMNNACSPEILAKVLKVSPDVARDLFGRLIARGTISAPSAAGISTAARPFYANMRGVNPLASSPMDRLRKIAKQVEGFVEEDEGVEEDVPSDLQPVT